MSAKRKLAKDDNWIYSNYKDDEKDQRWLDKIELQQVKSDVVKVSQISTMFKPDKYIMMMIRGRPKMTSFSKGRGVWNWNFCWKPNQSTKILLLFIMSSGK